MGFKSKNIIDNGIEKKRYRDTGNKNIYKIIGNMLFFNEISSFLNKINEAFTII